MNYLINQLMTVDKSLLPSLSGNATHPEPHPCPHPLADVHAAVESQDFPYTGALSRTAAHQPVHGAGKDEIRFMKGWKLKELEKIMPAWQRRQCEEIKRERWRRF